MRALAAFAVGAALGLAQLGAAPVLFADARAAPLLPLAALAGWSAARGAGEAAPGLLGAALVLGIASEDAAGWFVLASAPAAALLAAAEIAPPSRRLLLAPLAAALGAAAYTAVLHAASGRLDLLGAHADAAIALTAWTCALAAACALAAWPLRPREPKPGLLP